MSQSESSASAIWGAGSGGRRKKVYEYLKAANELRQSYAAEWTSQRNNQRDYNDDYNNTPGAFPDIEIARAGDEEMVLFPSYARRLVPGKTSGLTSRRRRSSTRTIEEYRRASEDLEPGTAAYEEFEDEKAVVAADVRGWIYAPQRGPMTRKHRLMVALARRLSGIPAPAPTPQNDSEESNSNTGLLGRMAEQRDEEFIENEMQPIINAGGKGEFAEKSNVSEDRDPTTSPGRLLRKTPTEPSQLSKDELTIANAHLMERLRPFLTSPMAEMPVTVFFFNEEKSQSRNVMTDESGHFNLRAKLPFVPTHIRVLASEELSAAKAIQTIEPTGISLISDIDDTIKHSAIINGAKEIFRNTFVRELADLKIDGVTEWYNKLAEMGIEMHYVSNAPWQLYPLLERYFRLVGLPPGSFHLKQYSGMLQGIFEPAAERKRGSLEQILRDFPERKFILVGDSGEADLEVYTDIALANPGRILGIFIRDVTTQDRKKFFEKSVDQIENPQFSRSTPQLVDDSDSAAKRPALPPRRPRDLPDLPMDADNLDIGDLIDLRDEEDQKPIVPEIAKSRPTPAKPSKPTFLRSATVKPDTPETIKRKPVLPPPPRRQPQPDRGPKPSVSSQTTASSESYASSVKSVVETVTNALPAAADYLPVRPKTSYQNGTSKPQEASDMNPVRSKQAPPLPPPRRTNTGASNSSSNAAPNRPGIQKTHSFPLSERFGWISPPSSPRLKALSRSSTSSVNIDQQSDSTPTSLPPLPNKREELWCRRWARAEELLGEQGVVLGSWRVGKDVQDVSIWLVQDALKDIQKGTKVRSEARK